MGGNGMNLPELTGDTTMPLSASPTMACAMTKCYHAQARSIVCKGSGSSQHRPGHKTGDVGGNSQTCMMELQNWLITSKQSKLQALPKLGELMTEECSNEQYQ